MHNISILGIYCNNQKNPISSNKTTNIIEPTPFNEEINSCDNFITDAKTVSNRYLIKSTGDKYKFLALGKSIVDEFNSSYPNVKSSSMVDIQARQAKSHNPVYAAIMEKLAIKYTDKYVEMLENIPLSAYYSNDSYINKIKQNIKDYNLANCGERAFLVQDELNKKEIPNMVIEIGGKKNYQSHVFNVIGMDKNADSSNPDTYGDNAIVIDTWLNKVMPFKEAVEFYHKYFLYDENGSKMTFTQDNLDEIRQTTIKDLKAIYEKKIGKPVSMEEFGKLTTKDIFAKG